MTFKSIVFLLWSATITFSQAKGVILNPDKEQDAIITQEEADLILLTNKERQREGLHPLKANLHLIQTARNHSANMAFNNELSHTLRGQDLVSRIKPTGYRYVIVGENIAKSPYPLSHVMEMWMDSQGHRENILNPHFSEIGVGIYEDNDGYKYATQVFGDRK